MTDSFVSSVGKCLLEGLWETARKSVLFLFLF